PENTATQKYKECVGLGRAFKLYPEELPEGQFIERSKKITDLLKSQRITPQFWCHMEHHNCMPPLPITPENERLPGFIVKYDETGKRSFRLNGEFPMTIPMEDDISNSSNTEDENEEEEQEEEPEEEKEKDKKESIVSNVEETIPREEEPLEEAKAPIAEVLIEKEMNSSSNDEAMVVASSSSPALQIIENTAEAEPLMSDLASSQMATQLAEEEFSENAFDMSF